MKPLSDFSSIEDYIDVHSYRLTKKGGTKRQE